MDKTLIVTPEERKMEIDKLAWQIFQDELEISFRSNLTDEERRSITDTESYQTFINKAKRLYEKRLIKKEKALSSKKYKIIDVPAYGKSRWGGGAYTLCFVYSKNNGNFILRGYHKEVEDYLKKNYTHYFYNMTLWYHGNNRDIWGFWKKDVGIFEPRRNSNVFKGKDKWNFKVRPYTFSWDDNYEERKTLADEKTMYFKRMPKRWIPEFDKL